MDEQTTIQEKHTFEDSWRWPREVRHYVRGQVDDYDTVLNVCAGQSEIGDVQLDADPSHDPDVVGGMRNLPFGRDSFDAVVSDPPWRMGYHQRFKPFYEAIRVCKPGGIIVYNARWVGETDRARLVEKRIRQDDPWANVSVITVWQKTQHRLDDVTAEVNNG